MKIFAISDLHITGDPEKSMEIFGGNWVGYLDKIKADWEKKVSAEDIVLISGDISWAMTLENALKDINTLGDLKGKKVFIKGNHDYWWQGIGRIRNALEDGFYALQNDGIKFGNVVICGSRGWCVPGSPEFQTHDEKIYLREIERFKLSLKAAAKLREDGDKLIAMIHYPPFTLKHEDTGFTEIFEEYGVNAVVYGHLHGAFIKADRLTEKNGVKYYLTSCDMIDNKLTEIEI